VHTLSIDIETYSSIDLKTSGVYKYVEAPDFAVLILAHCHDNDPVFVHDFTSTPKLPAWLLAALCGTDTLKTAHNANFERVCLSKFLNVKLPATQWRCTMAHAAYAGLPLGLDAAGKALGIAAEKDSRGKALIRYFSMPCKPTKANGMRTRNLPAHDPAKWEEYKEYCRQDVVVERDIADKLIAPHLQMPESESFIWQLDQKINDKGVLLDKQFVKNAIHISSENTVALTKEAIQLTGLDNPNSVNQLKAWLMAEADIQVGSLSKHTVPELIKQTDCEKVTRVLNIRQEMSKTSVKKYVAMLKGICSDNRLRGLLQYYGANRTGRWAGRLVQVHNLPRTHMKDIRLARETVADGNLELLEMLYGNVPDTLSQLVRPAFVSPIGSRLLVADFSAIEARVIAWLAGERWRLDVFRTHGKIYEASASQMFNVPLESVTKESPLRQKGKMSELALGYQGGPDAIVRIEISNETPVEKRIPVEELPKIVKMWRNANKAIVRLWYDVQNAAIKAVESGAPVTIQYGIKFFVKDNIFFIQLPSGRRLSYLHPKLIEGQFGMMLTYKGMNQTTKQWGMQDTYGGKLVENIVQAIARDLLANSLVNVDKAGYNIVMHVHDEIVVEEVDGEGSVKDICDIMAQPVAWAPGLPLKAAGFETPYYLKD
jgi:DNA polymerase bacteriophage-type